MKKWNIRRINGWISLGMILLLLVHMIAGGFQLLGFSSGGKVWMQLLSWILVGFLFVHTILGCWLTVETLRLERKAKVSYPAENRMFWIRRISGFAMLLLLVYHILVFAGKSGEHFRLTDFGTVQLVASLALVLSMLVHILSNIKPMLIALGAGTLRKVLLDILLVGTVLLFFAGAAFVVYYLRWNVFWR